MKEKPNKALSAQQIIPLAHIAGRFYHLKDGTVISAILVEADMQGSINRLTDTQEIERIKAALSGMNTAFKILLLKKVIAANTALQEIDEAIQSYEMAFRSDPDSEQAQKYLVRAKRARENFKVATENEVYYQNQRESLAYIMLKGISFDGGDQELRDKTLRIITHLQNHGLKARSARDEELYELSLLYFENETSATPLPDPRSVFPVFERSA